jgi:protein ImuA
MSRPQHSLSALRQRIAKLDPAPTAKAGGAFALGAGRVDQRLGGGLARAALHEIFADEADASAASAFALILALRGGALNKPILWVREDRVERRSGQLYGSGLVELGANPDRFIFVHAPDELATLRAAADSVKCAGVGAVVIEPYGKARALDLTATRRLALAAGASGVLTLLLRVGAEPIASAAQTRWQVGAAPSVPLEGNAPGVPALDVTLLRHRAGIASFNARLEWDRDQQICVEQNRNGQALSGSVSAAAALRSDQAKAA